MSLEEKGGKDQHKSRGKQNFLSSIDPFVDGPLSLSCWPNAGGAVGTGDHLMTLLTQFLLT